MKPIFAILAAAAFASCIATTAQTQHSGHDHGAKPQASGSASTNAYRTANGKMHKDMDIKFTGNPDGDFLRGMIPHHQGAIDMAKVVLQYGSDPEVKKLAQDIIAAQEKEIAMMKEWLAKKKL